MRCLSRQEIKQMSHHRCWPGYTRRAWVA